MRLALILPLALATSACSAAPAAVPPFAMTGRVVDRADLLDPPAEAGIAAASRALEARTGHQFVVATTPTLNGAPIERYSLALFGGWKVGRRCCADGVGLLVAPNERKVRIEVGKGLEATLSDTAARQILDRDVLPAFRQGDLPRGIERGSRAIVAVLS